jgi:hypothetical protein
MSTFLEDKIAVFDRGRNFTLIRWPLEGYTNVSGTTSDKDLLDAHDL